MRRPGDVPRTQAPLLVAGGGRPVRPRRAKDRGCRASTDSSTPSSAPWPTTMPDFLVPDLGEGLEEATIVAWLVVVGDEVGLNQPLCIVETAKAEVEIPSPYVGTVTE